MSKLRFAGDLLKRLRNGWVGQQFKKSGLVGPNMKRELGTSAVLDVGFGALYGAMTPGDLGDKLIAGSTSAAGGIIGSAGLRGITGSGSGLPLMLTEAGGNVLGDFAAQPVADSLMRIKGGGTTPYEKLAAEERELLKQQILAQFLRGKGGYTNDASMLNIGLA